MRGFTLLEMLVVLVILGMAAGLIAPSLSRTVDRVREAGDRDDVRRLLQALPVLVRESGRGLRLSPGERVPMTGRQWPEGWQVIATTDIVIEASGWCRPGRVQAQGPSVALDFSLAEPDCRVEERDAP